MNLNKWFSQQLQTSGETFAWSVDQVPLAHHFATPPKSLGEWTVARHLFHLVFYEKNAAIPGMKQWLGGPLVSWTDYHEDAAWNIDQGRDIPALLSEFKQVRNLQLELIAGFTSSLWEQTLDSGWGPVTLQWVVTKTLQHTAEHTNAVLRITLFWESAQAAQAAREKEQQAQTP